MLTLVTHVSRTRQGEPAGATRAEIAADGPSTALNGDPASQASKGYDASVDTTDITTAELGHGLASGVSLSDTLYSYGLHRTIDQGRDPNGEIAGLAVFLGRRPGFKARALPWTRQDKQSWTCGLRVLQTWGRAFLDGPAARRLHAPTR